MSPPLIQSPRTIPSGRGKNPLLDTETAWRIGPVHSGTENPEDEMSSGCAAAVPSRGRPKVAAARPAFSHPDFTVGSGVPPDPAPKRSRALPPIGNWAAGPHPAPKADLSHYTVHSAGVDRAALTSDALLRHGAIYCVWPLLLTTRSIPNTLHSTGAPAALPP